MLYTKKVEPDSTVVYSYSQVKNMLILAVFGVDEPFPRQQLEWQICSCFLWSPQVKFFAIAPPHSPRVLQCEA
jgi:hypothetical protein